MNQKLLESSIKKHADELIKDFRAHDDIARLDIALYHIGEGAYAKAARHLESMHDEGATYFFKAVIAQLKNDSEKARSYLKKSAELGYQDALIATFDKGQSAKQWKKMRKMVNTAAFRAYRPGSSFLYDAYADDAHDKKEYAEVLEYTESEIKALEQEAEEKRREAVKDNRNSTAASMSLITRVVAACVLLSHILYCLVSSMGAITAFFQIVQDVLFAFTVVFPCTCADWFRNPRDTVIHIVFLLSSFLCACSFGAASMLGAGFWMLLLLFCLQSAVFLLLLAFGCDEDTLMAYTRKDGIFDRALNSTGICVRVFTIVVTLSVFFWAVS